MKKQILFFGLLTALLSTTTYGQDTDTKFGLKGGVNYSKYTPDVEVFGIEISEYQRKFGFYVGGFVNLSVSEKFKIQPEVLFGLQGTSVSAGDLEFRSGPNDIPIVGEFKQNITESTIIVPVVGQFYVSEKFYFEAGPQFGFIVDTKDKVVKTPFINEDFLVTSSADNDVFDFGMTLGAGYKLSDNFALNGRYFFGIIERDNAYKSSVFNLGIEYQL